MGKLYLDPETGATVYDPAPRPKPFRYFRCGGAVAAAVARGELGVPCCPKAVKRYCVCSTSQTCPDHGDVCVGSHE